MRFDEFCREMFSCIPAINTTKTKTVSKEKVISVHRDDEGVLSIYRYQTPIGWISYDKAHRCYKAVTAGGDVCNFNAEDGALRFVHEQYS